MAGQRHWTVGATMAASTVAVVIAWLVWILIFYAGYLLEQATSIMSDPEVVAWIAISSGISTNVGILSGLALRRRASPKSVAYAVCLLGIFVKSGLALLTAANSQRYGHYIILGLLCVLFDIGGAVLAKFLIDRWRPPLAVDDVSNVFD